MDVRKKDEKGLTICPQCHKHYKPVLPERTPNDKRLIQQIYPDAKSWEREQLITGICSNACWKRYLGVV